MNEQEKIARICKILSVATRVRMLDLLKRRTLCVNALSRILRITPAAVSQHLRILRDAHIVKAEKKGYYVHYTINNTTLADWCRKSQRLLEPGHKD